jgi:hypothetical protein
VAALFVLPYRSWILSSPNLKMVNSLFKGQKNLKDAGNWKNLRTFAPANENRTV